MALDKNYDAPIVRTTVPAQRPASLNDSTINRVLGDVLDATPGGVAGHAAGEVAGPAINSVNPLANASKDIGDPNFWLRVVFIGGGLFLMMLAVTIFLEGNKTVQQVETAAVAA
jgi:hypothetical protein